MTKIPVNQAARETFLREFETIHPGKYTSGDYLHWIEGEALRLRRQADDTRNAVGVLEAHDDLADVFYRYPELTQKVRAAIDKIFGRRTIGRHCWTCDKDDVETQPTDQKAHGVTLHMCRACHPAWIQKGLHVFVIPDYLPPTTNVIIRASIKKQTRLLRECGDFVFDCAANAKIPHANTRRRVTMTLTKGPRNQTSDWDSSWKYILDALVGAKLLVDDSPGWCEVAPLQQEEGTRMQTAITLEDV